VSLGGFWRGFNCKETRECTNVGGNPLKLRYKRENWGGGISLQERGGGKPEYRFGGRRKRKCNPRQVMFLERLAYLVKNTKGKKKKREKTAPNVTCIGGVELARGGRTKRGYTQCLVF